MSVPLAFPNWRPWLLVGAVLLAAVVSLGVVLPPWSALFATFLLAGMAALAGVPDSYLNIALVVWPLTFAVVFYFWVRPQLSRESKIPGRSYVLLFTAGVLSALFFLQSWDYGIKYQGRVFTTAMLLVNLAMVALLLFLGYRATRTKSMRLNLLFHWILFAWIGYCAFPWLGEML